MPRRCTGSTRRCARYLREELGCKQLINAGNWRTADAAKLDDAERWSYTANEVIAVNRYYSPVHIGPDRGWRIDPGDSFEDASVLLRPLELPLNLRQAAGPPDDGDREPLGASAGLSVGGAVPGGGLSVAYGRGCLLLVWNGREPSGRTRIGRLGLASRAKWAIANPMVLGQFPAAALLFRKHYLKQGEPVVEELRSLDEIWKRVPPILPKTRAMTRTATRATLPGGQCAGRRRPAGLSGWSGEG